MPLKNNIAVFILFFFNLSKIVGFYYPNPSVERDPNRSIFADLRPVIGLDAHRSFFLNQWVKVNGVRLGINILDQYRFGLGGYASEYIRVPDIMLKGDTFLGKTNFNYSHIFFEYVWKDTYRWNCDAGIALGSGNSNLTMKRMDNLLDTAIYSEKVGIIELYGSVEYKIWPFLGFATGFGYRLLTPEKNNFAQKEVSKAFSSPFYDMNIRIHLGELYKFMFKKEEYLNEREQYKKSKK